MNDRARTDIAADWLQRLQTAPNDERLVRQWADWCQADPENLSAFEGIEAVWQALDTPRTRALLPARPDARKYLWPLAASVLLTVGICSVWYLKSNATTEAHTLTTNVAEHGSQILSDGSHVDLGARTRIATQYTDAVRSVTIETGEAFFDVARDAKRPFIVQAGEVRVTALGTAFGVRRTHDRTMVTVTEGLVRIVPEVRSRAAHQVEAGAGEQITFVHSTRSLTMAPVDPKVAMAWRDGILKFVNEPLSAVVDDVNRYSRHEIAIDSPALRDRLYSGTIYRDRIDEWLSALEEVFPLESVEKGDRISLVEKSN